MKRIFVGVGVLIVLSAILFMGCDRGKLVVYLSNQSMDNMRIQPINRHLSQGEKIYLTLLTIDEPTYIFEVWRSQGGHLANVSIEAIDLPDDKEPNISDTIVMMESSRNNFSAFTEKSHVAVDITNLQ